MITHPFVSCDSCVNGYTEEMRLCDKCDGTGRIYFQLEPGFTTRLREWWDNLPTWKRLNIIGAVSFGICVLIALAIVGVVDHYWPVS